MKQGSTLFLKLAVILIGIPVLALCIFFVPELAKFAEQLYPDFVLIKYLVLLYLYATAIPFYYALYQAFKLLNYIDRNKAFSDLSVVTLNKIKYSAFAISILHAAGMPLVYLIAEADDAPGLIAIGLVIMFAAIVVAVFAALLQKLLKEAVDWKSEIDLTV
jgi:hypothetical protein